ncbi:MAG: GyrI-like domain-containing protein [Ruminococcus sp.]|nr:GyrI-like domain-containing protein [Ruminococcus sp.]
MYSIGEFSKIGSVSTKTLRYYDEIGLLRPAYVDEENRYRYYEERQVDEILLISELKTYDLRLEQIKAIMESGNLSLLEHFLQERITQLNHQIEENVRLRQCIERKVQEIQSGGKMMEQKLELTVEAKEFEPVWVLSKKATIDVTQVGVVIGQVFESIFKNGLQPAGPVMTFYWDREFHQENANIEVCVPVIGSDEKRNVEGVKLLSPGLCATCTYVGPYHKMGKAYAAVLKWMEEQQYQVASAPFDVYLSDPKQVTNPEEFVTQIWFPIMK